ncbi:MAG TPA: hypothetical protein VLA19_05725, partial [Herpetosiphonaceae bacterium]|nr:hypothetical protein [Herpetosiphonaceae bacterium]
ILLPAYREASLPPWHTTWSDQHGGMRVENSLKMHGPAESSHLNEDCPAGDANLRPLAIALAITAAFLVSRSWAGC